MAVRVIPARDAFLNMQENPAANWPRRTDPINRLGPTCKPRFTLSFSVEPGAKVFTMGSCFARHVEAALALRGFDVVTRGPAARQLLSDLGSNSLNLFGVASIYNELSWALGEGTPFNEEANFVEFTPGKFVDLHLPASVRPASLDTVRKRRSMVNQLTREVVDSKLVIITLGLAELWFDNLTSTYLNFAPRKAMIAGYPDRFALHVLDFDTTARLLRASIRLLRRKAREDQCIVLTVSPVPLLLTFTKQDVITANLYSKSVLRAAAEEIAAEEKAVDYFPSYESVMHSNHDLAWHDDLRHVTPAMIELNVTELIEACTTHDERIDVDKAVASAQEHLSARNPQKAMSYVEPIADRLEAPEHLFLYAELCAAVGRHAEALRIFEDLPQDFGGSRRLLMLGRLRLRFGEAAVAFEIASRLADAEPNLAAGWFLVGQCCSALGRWDDAVVAIKRGSNLQPKRGHAYRMLADVYARQGKIDAAVSAFEAAIEREPYAQTFHIDYAEFLIDQKRFGEAHAALSVIAPENLAQAERVAALKRFVA
jgi:tetratricopeptide (TPR) repeat protein